MATSADALALAAQYHATGNLDLAEHYAQSVLSEEPSHAEALQLLGLIARTKGNLDQALIFLNKSLTSDGSNAVTWQHAGDILLAAGDLRGGITYYEQSLRLRPDFGEGYNTLGIAWKDLGDWARAAACFRQATRLLPSFVPAYNNLGNALRSQGKGAEAVEAFKQALQQWPDSPDVAYNLGNTYHDQGDLDQAVPYYRQALRLKPGYAAEVSNSLATAFKEQGLLEEAVAQYQETLKLKPDHAMAIYNLSELAAAGRYDFPPEELNRIRALAASGRCPPLDESLCAFAVANLLDLQGSYDEAFGYYQQANDLQKGLLKKRSGEGRSLAFDARAHEAQIDRIMAEHGRSYFERVKKWGTTTELPVFIIGMPRCGSTLVEQILASHPKVFGGGEVGNVYGFISQVTRDKTAPHQPDPPARDAQARDPMPNVRAARTLAADYLQGLANLGKRAAGQGASRVTIKNLENFMALGVIATLFSNARVIHCRRDPLDICLSCYFQNFPDTAWASSLEDIGAYCRGYEKLMAHWSRVLPCKVHEVCYEELIHEQETVSRKLLSFCGLDWDDRCLTFWNTRRVIQTASSVQVRQPIYKRAIGRWRHYRSHLGPLFQALALDDKVAR